MGDRARVLVTDGEQRAALAVVRSLGLAGYDVYVCARQPRSVAGASRFVHAESPVAGALAAPASFIRDIQALIVRWNIDVLIPISDASLETLLPVRDDLGGAAIPFADLDSYRALSNKREVLDVARDFGMAVPNQCVVERREDLVASVGGLRFPLILKPANSIRANEGHLVKLDVSYATDHDALAARAASLHDAAFPMLVQERITGPGTGVFLLMWDGELLANFAHQRIREKPPSGGETVYTESIEVEPTLLAKCIALVRHFGWRGALMIEFKVDERTGTPYLMEVNARFWAGLQLAIDSGVDFPALLVDAALGRKTRATTTYDVGTRVRWFWGDVDNLLTRLTHSARHLNLPPTQSPGRLSAMKAFLRTTLRREPDAIFRRDDPRPFLRETRQWLWPG